MKIKPQKCEWGGEGGGGRREGMGGGRRGEWRVSPNDLRSIPHCF